MFTLSPAPEAEREAADGAAPGTVSDCRAAAAAEVVAAAAAAEAAANVAVKDAGRGGGRRVVCSGRVISAEVSRPGFFGRLGLERNTSAAKTNGQLGLGFKRETRVM